MVARDSHNSDDWLGERWLVIGGWPVYVTFEDCIHGTVYRVSRTTSATPWPIQFFLMWPPLPERFIVKIQEDATTLQREKSVLLKLQPDQGRLTTRFYGTAQVLKDCSLKSIGLAMEYIDGKHLFELPREERQDAAESLYRCYEDISSRGIIHGDPKSDNVFVVKTVGETGEQPRVLLIDWGEAICAEDKEKAWDTNLSDCSNLLEDLKWDPLPELQRALRARAEELYRRDVSPIQCPLEP